MKGQSGTRTPVDVVLLALGAEKLLQHLALAAFFAVDLPGIGHPDLGPWFEIAPGLMAGLNLIYALLFALCLAPLWQARRGVLGALSLLAGADIVLEFIFHGVGFITVSVIVSALILVFAALAARRGRLAA